MGARPSRVQRLRARRARRRAVLGSLIALAVVVVGVVVLTRSSTPKPSPRAEARPTVQGSTASEWTPLEVPEPLPVPSMFSVDTASEVRPVERGVGVWVAATRGLRALGALKLNAEAAPSAIPPSRLVLHRPVAVRVEVLGKDLDELTNAATVGQLLSAMGIEPDGDDHVAPPLQTPLHPSAFVRFDRVDLRTLTVTSDVEYAVHTTSMATLPAGQVRVVTPGADGELSRTYRVRLVNGHEVSRTLVSQTVVRTAVDEVRETGTAQPSPSTPPSPAPRPSPTTPPTPRPSAHTESGQATWYGTGTPGLYAAHPWLPFGTHVTVTDLANGRTVTVIINDRGPFGGRIIDLSSEAFALLAPLPTGVIDVRLSW